MIKVTATVIRDGQPGEIPLQELVPGDVVKLAAGDMIPADVRLVAAKDLFLVQASLTGESLPVEKTDAPEPPGDRSPVELRNLCFIGTSVESGTAHAVVVATGPQTYLGGMARSLSGQEVETNFDRGVKKFTWLMIRFMMVMVPLVFLINGFNKHNWKEAFFFALAVAVGLTPEMLPTIVSVCLSKGAIMMSRKKVIVKRLNAIQNFGAMDVLCTDKTGTLTMDRVILQSHCDVVGEEADNVLQAAYLISHFQTGLKDVLDRATLDYGKDQTAAGFENYRMVDEIPFDFSRRIMSVVVETPQGTRRILAKGAPEEIFKRSAQYDLKGDLMPMEQVIIDDLREEYEDLSSDGFRVLAVAYKDLDARPAYSKADESDLVLIGYVAFLDPPKDTATTAIAALQRHGITVKILTGDNDLVSRKICREVGLPTDTIVLGADVERMTDAELGEAAEKTTLFARLSPMHKRRVIKALQGNGHVVGFLGDGINDAPALRAADVSVSVDTAEDVAKETADVILLEKSLMVLDDGVIEGRKVFINILRYIRMGASSNFGNMFSVLGASALLPYVPMTPMQVLTNNLLYDFSQTAIPTDNVDPDLIAKPLPWGIEKIARYIIFVGPISSIFDYTTYAMMWFLFKCKLYDLTPPAAIASRFANPSDWDHTYAAALFQTGWFVESLMTQTLIIHVIRTNKIPFLQGRASWPLTVTTVIIMAFAAWLPFSPLAGPLGFVPLPGMYWPLLALTLLCYMGLTQVIKMGLLRKGRI
jgi:Mg2+-importing ATPase